MKSMTKGKNLPRNNVPSDKTLAKTTPTFHHRCFSSRSLLSHQTEPDAKLAATDLRPSEASGTCAPPNFLVAMRTAASAVIRA